MSHSEYSENFLDFRKYLKIDKVARFTRIPEILNRYWLICFRSVWKFEILWIRHYVKSLWIVEILWNRRYVKIRAYSFRKKRQALLHMTIESPRIPVILNPYWWIYFRSVWKFDILWVRHYVKSVWKVEILWNRHYVKIRAYSFRKKRQTLLHMIIESPLENDSY